ncbi:MAG: hypothetical protein GEU83_08650 [Pseudonocardiaceae bacterium]|nr:hypothetical protein [Pseudonocardiaceae bacterium]
MGKRKRASRTGNRELDKMVEAMEGLLLDAVGETLDSGLPAPARDRIARVIEIDDEVDSFESGPPPGQTFALIILTSWLSTPMAGHRADADEVLDWIGDNLGARYRARAKYVIGMLDPNSAAETVQLYGDALADDLLPTLIWIASALVARYGDGNPASLSHPVPAGS